MVVFSMASFTSTSGSLDFCLLRFCFSLVNWNIFLVFRGCMRTWNVQSKAWQHLSVAKTFHCSRAYSTEIKNDVFKINTFASGKQLSALLSKKCCTINLHALFYLVLWWYCWCCWGCWCWWWCRRGLGTPPPRIEWPGEAEATGWWWPARIGLATKKINTAF